MARWQPWKSRDKKQHKAMPICKTRLTVERLEDRTVMSGPSVAPGYTLTIFATNPSGSSQPDSIAVDGGNVYVGFGDGVAKDGSDGKSSTVVQFNTAGDVVQTFSVPGHNDGLKVDPETHLLWALQNEDGNPNLVVINPATGTETKYTFGPVANGGGFDDITFLHGKVYLSESNPANNPNTAPAVVQATLSGTMVNVSPVLFGDAPAVNAVTKQPVTLNLQDPDSMTASPSGNLVMTSQADDEIVIIKHPDKSNQSVNLLPLIDPANNPVSVDDTLFRRGAAGEVLFTDLSAGIIYALTGPPLKAGLALSAAPDNGQLGTLDFDTGVFTPIITGLGSPRGLAILPQKEINGRHSDQSEGHDEAHIAAGMNHDDLAAVVAVSRLTGTSAAQIERGDGFSLHPMASDHGAEAFTLYQRTRAQSKSHAFAALATDLDD
jgi:hypothetical protein